MTERATRILTFVAGSKAGWLSKGKPSTIAVALLAEFDPSWARDGITEKPVQRMGQRQWWAQQMIAAVPPAHWTSTWQCSAADCIAAATGDFADLLLTAWADATTRHPNADWAAALLRAAAREGRGTIRVELLNVLPEAQRLSLLAEVLESPRLDIDWVQRVIEGTRFPLDARAAAALLAQVDRHAASSAAAAGFDYHLQQLLNTLAFRVPPDIYDELVARWVGPYWEANRRSLDQCLATLQIRRDVQREFTT